MKKLFSALLAVLFLAAGLIALSACTITPGIGIGVDFDYHGGKFHARPTANIGITGRP